MRDRKILTVSGVGISSPITSSAGGYKQARIDAQLIAAAPDLLAALQAFVEHGTCFDGDDFAKARAAIAKAMGTA